MKGQPLQLKYRSLLSIVLLILPLSVWCQHIITITDIYAEPLEAVQIYNTNQDLLLITDRTGNAMIPTIWQDSARVVVTYIGSSDLSLTTAELRATSTLELQSTIISETVVLVGRTYTNQEQIINQVEAIDSRSISLTQPQTTVEALEQNSNVYVQRSQMGGGSPVLRGFEANRVLLVSDGVRMNNAIYRSGHLQNAITLDAQTMEQVEVIYGPGALLYGSDALGGVIHFRSREPQLRLDDNTAPVSLTGLYRTASVNNEQTVHLSAEVRGKQLSSYTAVTHSRFGDLRSGRERRFGSDSLPFYGLRLRYQAVVDGRDTTLINDNSLLQIGTAYDQTNILQKLKYQANRHHSLLLNVQAATSSNVPRYDLLAEVVDGAFTWAEWAYGPQLRNAISLESRYSKPSRWWDNVTTIAAYQRVREQRINRRYQSSIISDQVETVDVYSLTIDGGKSINASTINYGVEVSHNTVQSRQHGTLNSGLLTRYADGQNSMSAAALYLVGQRRIGDDHTITAGGRYSLQRVSIRYDNQSGIDWPSLYYDGVTSDNAALTGSIGHKYTNGKWSVSSMVASAFRSPNIDDQAKIRVRRGEVTIPNLELDSERSYTAETTIARRLAKKGQLSITGFHTTLQDALVQSGATLPDGRSTLNDRGEVLQTVTNVNAASAWIRGVSINVNYNISQQWKLDGSTSYTRGRQSLDGESTPLSHIPPIYGRAGLTYSSDKWTASSLVQWNGTKPAKDYGTSTDNLELATPDGTPGWYIVNLYTSWSANDHISINASLENLFDRFYRSFASGVNGPGRGVSIAVKATL